MSFKIVIHSVCGPFPAATFKSFSEYAAIDFLIRVMGSIETIISQSSQTLMSPFYNTLVKWVDIVISILQHGAMAQYYILKAQTSLGV